MAWILSLKLNAWGSAWPDSLSTLVFLNTCEQRGEGFSGTTIKDTWTKPRGRVEAGEGGGFGWGGVEGWGENADNCN